MADWLTGYSWKREKWRGLQGFLSLFYKISISVSCLYFTEYLEGISKTPNKYPVFFYIRSFTTQHFRKCDFITCLYIFFLLPEPKLSFAKFKWNLPLIEFQFDTEFRNQKDGSTHFKCYRMYLFFKVHVS